ncbi:MAG: hypothetical protein ABW298_15715 [Candidatus Binatia bacterium]
MRSLPQPMPRLSFEGFSLLPPQGDHWCVIDLNQKVGVVFGTTPLIGQVLTRQPTEEELDDILVAVANKVEIERDPGTSAEVRDFVDSWLRSGQPSHVDAGKRILARSSTEAARFNLVDSSVVIDDSIGSSCIRFDATVEERNNPRWPGEVLVSVERGNLLCRSPRTGDPSFVWIGASERYRQSRPPHPLLSETRAPEIEAFTRSLSFTQP